MAIALDLRGVSVDAPCGHGPAHCAARCAPESSSAGGHSNRTCSRICWKRLSGGARTRLTYQQAANTVIAEAKPSAIMYEGSCPRGELHRTSMIILRSELSLA